MSDAEFEEALELHSRNRFGNQHEYDQYVAAREFARWAREFTRNEVLQLRDDMRDDLREERDQLKAEIDDLKRIMRENLDAAVRITIKNSPELKGLVEAAAELEDRCVSEGFWCSAQEKVRDALSAYYAKFGEGK